MVASQVRIRYRFRYCVLPIDASTDESIAAAPSNDTLLNAAKMAHVNARFPNDGVTMILTSYPLATVR